MKNFEYNWATAEMVKLYLRNSCAQEAQKACMATEPSTGTQEVPAANNSGGASCPNINLDLDSDSDSDSSAESE